MSATGGHMNHPYELYDKETLHLSKFIDQLIIDPNHFKLSEKLDGFNLFATYINGKVILARNKTDLIEKNKTAKYYIDYYNNKELYNMSYVIKEVCDVLKVFMSNNDKYHNGKVWLNLEVLNNATNNILQYNDKYIVINDIYITDNINLNISDIILTDKKINNYIIRKTNSVYVDNTTKEYINDMISIYEYVTEIKNDLSKFDLLIDYYRYKFNKTVTLAYKEQVGDNTNKVVIDYVTNRMLAVIKGNNIQNVTIFMRDNKLSDIERMFVTKCIKNMYKLINVGRKEIELLFIEIGNIILKHTKNTVNNSNNTYYLGDIYKKQCINNSINPYFEKIIAVNKSLTVDILLEGIVIDDLGVKITGLFGSLNQVLFSEKKVAKN